jgi:hypothetical protein
MGGGPRNSFGRSLQSVVIVADCGPFWSPEIAAQDADGDGIPNGVELQDPEGKWTPGAPAPGDIAKVTNAGLPNVEFVRADSNGDGTLNVADALFTLRGIFQGGGPFPCDGAADANGDARINIVDPIFILNRLFLGGPEPPLPFPGCSLFSKGLPCQSYSACTPI